ncbi:hypothetical protein ATE84_4945 [Aquimarina sp. MAR_2010_214]|nr:hypothetical protein ATE84_4945 [Aquimarina sp. MAR_2010_214]
MAKLIKVLVHNSKYRTLKKVSQHRKLVKCLIESSLFLTVALTIAETKNQLWK